MPKRGRPKVRKAEFKKPFPMRFSDSELAEFKKAAGTLALREWMRQSLMSAAGAPHLTLKSIQEWAKTPNPELAAQLKELLQRIERGEKDSASPI